MVARRTCERARLGLVVALPMAQDVLAGRWTASVTDLSPHNMWDAALISLRWCRWSWNEASVIWPTSNIGNNISSFHRWRIAAAAAAAAVAEDDNGFVCYVCDFSLAVMMIGHFSHHTTRNFTLVIHAPSNSKVRIHVHFLQLLRLNDVSRSDFIFYLWIFCHSPS